jgi:hypothetical protein
MVGGWRGLLGFISESVDLDGALGLGAVNAEFAGGGPESADTATAGTGLSGACCATFLIGQPHPFCDMLRPFKRS